MKSKKEEALDGALLKMLEGLPLQAAKLLIKDKEIHNLQDYANVVSIKRLSFNDHGPVHMKTVAINAVKMAALLNQAGIKLNLEAEGIGTFEDSKTAIVIAAFIHDIGMTIGRENHEKNAIIIAYPILNRLLEKLYPDNFQKLVIMRSLITECIVGHMATQRIHSLEAGIILVADGCDMEKGRARIPMMINTESRVGDIHKYSASEINKVRIEKGDKKPIKIKVEMNESVGFFQVEEVLLGKINFSPVKPYVELYAGVTGREAKRYL